MPSLEWDCNTLIFYRCMLRRGSRIEKNGAQHRTGPYYGSHDAKCRSAGLYSPACSHSEESPKVPCKEQKSLVYCQLGRNLTRSSPMVPLQSLGFGKSTCGFTPRFSKHFLCAPLGSAISPRVGKNHLKDSPGGCAHCWSHMGADSNDLNMMVFGRALSKN